MSCIDIVCLRKALEVELLVGVETLLCRVRCARPVFEDPLASLDIDIPSPISTHS